MKTSAGLLHGLYVITDPVLAQKQHCTTTEMVKQALRGGARLVQYRDKGADQQRRLSEAQALLKLCRQFGVPLLINDDLDLTERIAADGVHLGQADRSVSAARERLGEHALIGVTCHDRLDLARAAEADGASYVAFGRFFPSRTKPGASPADPALLREAQQHLKIPIAAIGGIDASNAASLILAGADMLAVIHGVFGQSNIEAAARKITQQFD